MWDKTKSFRSDSEEILAIKQVRNYLHHYEIILCLYYHEPKENSIVHRYYQWFGI